MAKAQRPPDKANDPRIMLLGSSVLAAVVALFAWLKRKAITGDLREQREERERVADAARPRHQADTVNVGNVALVGGGLVVMIVASLLAAGGLFAWFANNPALPATPVSPLAETPQVPPEPRSEPNLSPNLQRLRATEDATLHSYGWVDRSNNVVRIPIDRAMDLLVQTGVPVGGTPVPQPNATPALQPTIQQ